MRKTALAILIVLVSAIAFADWDQGREAFSSGDFEGAAAHLETVLEEHSDYAPAHYMLGLCRYNLEQVAEAIPSLQRAADLEPDNAQYALALARALLGEGRADVACDRLKTLEYGAVPEEMRKVFAQMLAVAATRSGRPELAIPVLEATVEDEPGDASLWMALGQTRAGAADQVGAFEAYSKASSIDQSNSLAGRRAARTAITIAETLAEASDRQLWFGWAAELADTAAQHERVADSAMVAGKAWLGAKELDKARAAYAMALEREPSRVDTLYELGRVESLLDQDGPALEHLGRALELAEDPAMRRNIARSTAFLHQRRQNFAAAERGYRDLGDDARAAEMRRLGEIKANNEAVDEFVAACLERWQEMQRVKEESAQYVGSQVWQAILDREQELLAECGEALGLTAE